MASHRRTLAAALATVLAAVSLYPIFTGTLWFFAGLGSVVVVAAAGTATRLRPLPPAACVAGGVVALLLYLNLAFANSGSLFHLLPTPTSLRMLIDSTAQGFDEAAKYAPPVPELRGMVLLAAGGIGITALLTDLIAVRLRSAALAGLPLLLLFTEPFTLNVARGFLGTAVAFIAGVAGYLGLLSSEGKDRIREWEHADASLLNAPDTRTLAAAGRRVGFASVLLALCLPFVIPGLHATRLFGGQPGIGGNAGGGSGDSGAGIGFPSPGTLVSQELHMTQASNVLTYSTTAATPNYLQIYVLDKLTDNGWRMFAQPKSLARVSPLMPAPPGLSAGNWVSTVTTMITIDRGVGQDALAALPAPYPAASVSAPGLVTADRSTLMVFDVGVPLSGLKYTVRSRSEFPPEQSLNNSPSPPASIAGHYLQVPASYRSLRPLALAVTRAAHASTGFEDAVALQNWLAGGAFKYTLKAPSVTNADGLKRFLTVTKRGYCLQFAYAMAVLARLLGIPSRVAYGFTSGTPVNDGKWLVTTHDAHAWPELYFQGYGWLRFEPTPSGLDGQGTATVPSYTLAPGNVTPGPGAQTAPSGGPGGPASNGEPGVSRLQQQISLALGNLGRGANGAGADHAGAVNGWELAGLVLAGLLVAALTAPRCARLVIRRRRWGGHRRGTARAPGAWPAGGDGLDDAGGDGGTPASPDASGDVLAHGNAAATGRTARWRARRAAEPATALDAAWAHAAWHELRDDLVDYGAGYQPSESPRTVAARTGTSLALAEPAVAALDRIALAEERARYAATPADGSGLRRDSVIVRRAIAAAVPRQARWRAAVLPASVLGPVIAAIASASDIFGRLNPEWIGGFRRPMADR